MPIITRSAAPVESSDWQQILAGAFRNSDDLLRYLDLPVDTTISGIAKASGFPLLVPRPYADQMMPGNANDPLLRQVLAHPEELVQAPGFVSDPLEEGAANKTPGIIHKYRGRVLLLAASGCAVNCRYCFRRHFPYNDNRLSRSQWQQVLSYVANDSSITEIILSGGDPLMLQDSALADLIQHCEDIPHISRLRIHTRLPVVIPQRMTAAFIKRLSNSRLQTSIVLHINHAHELSDAHRPALESLRRGGVTLLNQSVLLKNVNNEFRVLADLSERLFEFGILPYYLHLLDRVAGAHHFEVEEDEAVNLHRLLLTHLPGYLVPRLVREVAGQESKAPINLDRL